MENSFSTSIPVEGVVAKVGILPELLVSWCFEPSQPQGLYQGEFW